MMLPAPLITTNRASYFLLLCLAICLPIAASAYLSKTQPHALHLSDYRSYQCSTGNTQAQRPFRVLTLFYTYATELVDTLCANELIRQQFSAVEILWRPRSYLGANHILDEDFDIFWNRHHVVSGLVPEFSNFYTTLTETPTYELYWISKDSVPTLTTDYLKEKTIGFSRDSQSQTHFLQPMSALRQAGISLSAQQKKFYTDPSAIYAAFNNNEVDIISGPLPRAKADDGAKVYTSLIDSAVPSGAWFIKNNLLALDNIHQVECAILNSLTVYAPLFDSINRPTIEQPACL
jgi:hypothetical protein